MFYSTSLVGLSLLAIIGGPSYAQFLTIGNLTQILPQCQDVCEKYNAMFTTCNATNEFAEGFKFCECNPTNMTIIETCFDCQAVNQTQEDTMQDLLDAIVDNCNEKFGSPDSTISIAPQKVVPTVSFSSSSSQGTGSPSSGVASREIHVSVAIVMVGIMGSALIL